MTYQPPPPPSYYPQQWPPPQPPKKKTPRFVIALIAVCAFGLAVVALGTSGSSSETAPSTKSRAAALPPTQDETAARSTSERSATAGPRETLRFKDGLTATITGITTGNSTNQFDHDGPITIVSVELRNAGTETLDAADWWTPYLNYGPRGMVAEEASIAGTVNGMRSDYKGSGLIPPGGVVTVNSAYEVALADLSPATITPRWPGRLLWSGDFTAEFSH